MSHVAQCIGWLISSASKTGSVCAGLGQQVPAVCVHLQLTLTICLSVGVWCRWALSQGQDFIANNQVPQIDFATFHRYAHHGMCFTE